jgi:aconitate decarboxylase
VAVIDGEALVQQFTPARDGTRLHTERAAPRGLEQLMSNEGIVAKYRHLTDGLLPAARQAAIERLVLDLDRLSDTRELSTLLGGAVAAPFEA